MKFEKWNSEQHSDFVPDFFSGDVIEPSELGKYREVVGEALKDIEDVYGINADFKVVFAEIDVERFREKFDGDIPPHIFFRGYSKSKKAHDDVGEDLMFLATSDEYEYWKPGLKDLVVHEESHFEFFDVWRGMENRIWEQILFEGNAIFREKEVIEEKGYYWQGRQDSFEGSAEKVKGELEIIQTRDDPDCMFNFGGDKWPDAKGYVIAHKVYRDIIDRNNLKTNEPLRKEETWLKKEIKKSLEKLYGEE